MECFDKLGIKAFSPRAFKHFSLSVREGTLLSRSFVSFLHFESVVNNHRVSEKTKVVGKCCVVFQGPSVALCPSGSS